MPTNNGIPEFDILRKRAQQYGNTQRDESLEAMKRRFATQGMVGSGAYQVASQQAEEMGNKATNEQLQNVDIAEMQEKQRRQEIADARTYQTAERESAQKYGTQERMGGQEFQSEQAILQRQFSQGMFDTDMQFKRDVQASNVRFAELDAAFRDREFEENKKTNWFNQIVAMKTSGMSEFDTQTLRNQLEWLWRNKGAPVTDVSSPRPTGRGRL